MSKLKAGAAKTDITPDYPVWMDGNPRDRKSEGVHDPLSARALVVEGADGPFALVSAEICGLWEDTVAEIRAAISDAAGIRPERQLIACAHVHSGPATRGFLCPRETEYNAWLVDKLAHLVAEARHNAAPALAGSGSGQEFTISECRRLWRKDGTIMMNWEDFPWDDILGPAGPADPEVGVVRIDAVDGPTIAVIYNHAGHPNTPPGTWFELSGDYPAFASAMIEGELGGVALFTNGAQGSVDIPAFRERDWDGVERKGTWLAREVLSVAKDIRPACDLAAAVRTSYPVAKRTIDPDYLKWARKIAAETGEHVVNIRDGIDDEIYARMCVELADNGIDNYELDMVGFTLGGAAFVSYPGELFTEIGLQIKRASPIEHTFIVDLANGSFGYVPTARAIEEGGYATRPGSGQLDAHAEDIIAEHALALLRRLNAKATH